MKEKDVISVPLKPFFVNQASKESVQFKKDLELYNTWKNVKEAKEYNNKWIAFQNGKVLCYGDDYVDVKFDSSAVFCNFFTKVGVDFVPKASNIFKKKANKGVDGKGQ